MNLNEMALKVHTKILEHDKIFKECSAATVSDLKVLSEHEIALNQQTTLVSRFGGNAAKKITVKKIKKKKEKPIPTHLSTLELLKKNQSIETITAERGLSTGTILSHIEKLKGLQMIEPADFAHLKNNIPESDFDTLFAELNVSEDGRLTPVYDKFAGKYSYEHIRLVRLFVMG